MNIQIVFRAKTRGLKTLAFVKENAEEFFYNLSTDTTIEVETVLSRFWGDFKNRTLNYSKKELRIFFEIKYELADDEVQTFLKGFGSLKEWKPFGTETQEALKKAMH